ncbi:MAG TPA: GatB/YqeY domain-containing protein [Campylobacterales bacterium]|nr:GatB/YqeY domain-containing protein [Campylobacterales bacterium]
MSQVKERLKEDLKTAMKAKDVFKRETIRFLMSALKQVEVDERRELSDDDIYKIIQKSIKQRDDAASAYKEADRKDLYEKEVNEANLLKNYLPKQLDEAALKEIISRIITENGASGMKDMGNVIKLTMVEVGAGADGKSVSKIVKELLN